MCCWELGEEVELMEGHGRELLAGTGAVKQGNDLAQFGFLEVLEMLIMPAAK